MIFEPFCARKIVLVDDFLTRNFGEMVEMKHFDVTYIFIFCIIKLIILE